MLGPMGARIIDLLKVMTPNEIDRYVEKKEESTELKMAAGAEEFDVTKSPVDHSRAKSNKDESHTADTESDEDNVKHEAKIIPLRGKDHDHNLIEENTEEDDQSNDDVNEEAQYEASKNEKELEKAGIYSANKIQAIKKEKLKRYKAKQESTSNFILNQREKLKQTKLRLIEQDAIKNYNLNSNVDTLNDEIDLDNPDEEACVGNKGILVNKKHF